MTLDCSDREREGMGVRCSEELKDRRLSGYLDVGHEQEMSDSRSLPE